MQYDEIIDSPRSGGDLCYKMEVTPEVTNYYSLSCGFWTNSLMKVGEDFYTQQMEALPELYKDLAWLDEKTKLIWLPHSINDENQGMVYASGTSAEEWQWAAVKMKPVEEDPDKPTDSKVKFKADMKTIAYFAERDYMDALSYIGLLPG